MDFIERLGKCRGCSIPSRLCWKTQPFVVRGQLYGVENRIPSSFCFLRSMIHQKSLGVEIPTVSIGVTPVDVTQLDMDKQYWIN